MQDKQMLGQGLLPNATVNAQVDMSQPTQKPKRFLPENFNPQKYIQKQESENLNVSFMDAVKAVGSGAASMFAGVGELGHQTIGVGAGLRDLSQSVSESLIDNMTPDGQAALNRSLFTENENGRLALGDGASDIDVWAMKIAQGLGSLAGTVLPGGAAGAAARVTLGRAITNNMMKRGLSEVAAKQVADKAVGHIAGAAALGGGFAGSLGGGALDAKAAVLDMDFNWLAENSDTFRDNAYRIMTDPKYADLSPKQRMELAREETAEHASQSMMANPISIAASAAGALGDKMLFGAITGKLGKSVAGGTIKGAVGEMAAEAMESGGQAYSINTTLNDVAGTDTDPWQGVKSAAAEGGVIGGMVGAPIGAVGGYRGSKQHSPLDQTPPSDNQTTELNSEERVDAPISNQNVSQTAPEQIKARFDESRSSLVESGVLPEQNDLQETIQLARALDPERAAQIEAELKDESISEERANQLEAEYFNLAENARRMDIDPVSAIVEDRLAANKKRSLKSEPSQQTEQKIQTELQPETLPAEIADKYGLPRDYEPTIQAQAIREQQGIALRDDLEMRSEPTPTQPIEASDVNQSAIDVRQRLLESEQQERDQQRLRAKDFDPTNNAELTEAKLKNNNQTTRFDEAESIDSKNASDLDSQIINKAREAISDVTIKVKNKQPIYRYDKKTKEPLNDHTGTSMTSELSDPLHPRGKSDSSNKSIAEKSDTKNNKKTGSDLYSRESFLQQAPAKGMTVKGAELSADQWLKNYKGGAGVKIQVVKTQPEAEAIMGASFDGSVVSALYSDARRLVVVVADNIENAKDLRQKLRHEVLVHHGLRAVVGDMEYMKIMERIARGKNSPHLKELWDTVDRNYKGFEPLYQVEEVLAHAAEIERPAIKRWFDNIVEMIAHALRRVGLMSSGDMTKAEMYNIVNTLSNRIKSINQWADKSRPEAKNTETRLSQTLFSQKSRVPEHAEIIKGEPVKGSTMKEKRLYAQQQGFSRAGIYINKDSGLEITVGRTGVKHTTSRKAFDHLLSSMKYIDRIIEDSLYIGSKPETKGNANVKAHHYFGIKYELEGQVHDVVVDVREMPDGKFYYDHSFEKDVLASGGNDSGSRLLPLEPDNNTSRVAEADEILTTHDSGVNNASEVHDTGSIKFSKRMNDSTNLDQLFVTNPGAISPRWKELVKLRGWWESASDVLRRNEATKPVAEAIDKFYDLTREHMGTVNTIIDPTFSKYRKLNKADKKAVDKEFENYMRAKESGNAPDKAKLSNMTRELVETWEQVADVTGRINKEVGVKVYDVVAKEWRDIGFLSKDFWPRKLRPEIQQALADPANHHDTWRAMAQALYDDGRIDSVDYQKASEYIGKEQAKLPKDSHNDYFAGTEQARGVALPAFFYDYTWDAAMQYKDKWAEATARIQSLGQRAVTGQDLIDTTAESITDQNTLKYLRATQDRIYNLVPNDSYIRGAATLNTLATGLQLGNPATALLNLIGGTALNFQAYGPVRATKALISELKDLPGNIKDARKVGILIDDYLMLQQDATQAGVNESLQKFATNMMKWGGYTPMELFIRTHSHVIAKNMLRESLAAWNQQIDSKKSLKEMAWYQRNGFDVDTLIAENGQGPETNRFYRKIVNTTQGSYRIDQTPIFVDSPIGKFLFKYQKFGTQLSRMFWINHLKPFIDSVTKGGETVKYTKDGKEYSARVKTFMPMVNFFGGAILAGAGLNALRAAIFGYDDPSPNLDEIEKALANDDTAKAVALSASLAWNSMMATGALGFFGNYIQMARDVADRQRVKSPIDPPALAPVKAFAELGLILAEQGTITKKDIDKLADTISIYRTTKRGVLGAADNVGLGFDVVRLEGIRRDRNDIRRYIRRYSNDIGLESKRRAPERYGKTEMSPVNSALIEAALLGQPERMKAIMRKHLESLKTPGEVQSALTSMRSAVRSAQPIRVSLSPSIRERAEFLKWAEDNLTDSDYQKMIEMDRAYVDAATAAGLMTKSRRNELARQERRHRTLTREFDSERARENFLRRLGV